MTEFEELVEALSDLMDQKAMEDTVPENVLQTVQAKFDAYIDARITAARLAA